MQQALQSLPIVATPDLLLQKLPRLQLKGQQLQVCMHDPTCDCMHLQTKFRVKVQNYIPEQNRSLK